MNVRLISLTASVLNDIKKIEDLIVYEARVSSPENQDKLDTGPKLLRYCLEQGHVSIFQMADMTVEIETSRAISAQILRHQSFDFQEQSQRYSKSTEFEIYEARRQDKKNRQNSIDDMSQEDQEWFIDAQTKVISLSKNLYEEALLRGIAKESSRFLLPLNTKTRLYMKGSVRSWIHYLDTRCDKSTQLEHREVAEAIKKIFIEQFPIVAAAKGWL